MTGVQTCALPFFGIAWALATKPAVLLCDEPTSALDPRTTDEILDLLLDLRSQLGLTILVITHKMHVVKRICDSVSLLKAGRIVFDVRFIKSLTYKLYPLDVSVYSSLFLKL